MITRKQTLLECLKDKRKTRDEIREKLKEMKEQGGEPQHVIETFETMEKIAQEKVEILQDIIHYLDTPHGREGMADWQKQEMKDPEKCRREAMDFVLEEIRM